MNRKLTPIATAVALLLATAAMSAHAQQAASTGDPAAKAADAPVETITVTGIRASLQKSLEQKRNADAHVDIITAEDVGKMPDKNVADSLARIPGVNVETAGGTEGGFGENDRVSLRGTPATMTMTMLNGHSVSTGDWLSSNILSSDRSVSYTLLPSEIIDRVTVYKGSQANLVEGGAIGTVNIETRRPLDFKEDLTLQGTVEGVYSSGAGKTDPQVNALINWKNPEHTMGIMLQAFDEKRTLHREGQEFLWWATADSLWGNNKAVLAANPGLSGKDISGLTGSSMFDSVRTTKGGNIDVEFRPSSALTLDVNGFYSRLNAPNSNYNTMQDVFNSITSGGISPTAYTVKGNTVTSYTMPSTCPSYVVGGCGNVSSQVTDMFVRPDAYSESRFLDLNLKYKATNDLTVSSKLGRTLGTGHSTEDLLEVWGPYTGGSYTTQGLGGAATVVVPGNNVLAASTVGCGTTVCANGGDEETTSDSETYFHLDGKLATHMDLIPSVEFGFRYSDHEHSLREFDPVPLPGATSIVNAPLGGLSHYPSNFGNGLGGSPEAGAWIFTPASVTTWASTYLPASAYSSEAFQNEFKLSEPTTAVYAMAHVNAEALTGNFGLRIVNAKENVTNYSASGAPVSINNTYVEVLPSANFRLDLTKDLVGRFSVSRTMARPEFGSLGGLSLQDIQQTGSGGNPNLKPITSNNMDLGLEWYFAPRSMVSAGIYYNAFDSYVTFGSSTGTFFNQLTGTNTAFQLSSPQNTTAEVKGLELAYEQAIYGGFGVSANFTLADGQETGNVPNSACASATHDCDMVGTSKDTYNFSAFFENDQFNARIGWTYRSAYLNGLNRSSAIYQDSVGSLSMALGYKISKNLSLTLEGKDLNNPLLKSYASTPDEPRAFYKNGSQVYLGLHGTM